MDEIRKANRKKIASKINNNSLIFLDEMSFSIFFMPFFFNNQKKREEKQVSRPAIDILF